MQWRSLLQYASEKTLALLLKIVNFLGQVDKFYKAICCLSK